MKFLVLFFLAMVLNAQNNQGELIWYYSGAPIWYSLDLDGSTEYAYVNTPSSLDLNSANYLASYDSDMTAVYTSDFSAGVDGWTVLLDCTVDGNIDAISDGVTSEDDVLRVTIGTANNYHIPKKTGLSLTTDDNYNFQFSYYIPSANTEVDGFILKNHDGDNDVVDLRSSTSTPATIGVWTKISVPYTATSTELRFYLTDGSSSIWTGNGTDVFYIKDFIITPTNYTSNGDTEISFAGGKMEVVATGTQDTDYVSISQDNFTSPTEHGKNYTIQLDASSLANSDYYVKLGNIIDTVSTTGVEATQAITMQYDSVGMTVFNETFNDSSGFASLQTSWSVANGVGHYDESLNHYFEKSVSITTGKYYRLRFTISDASTFAKIAILDIFSELSSYVDHVNGSYDYTWQADIDATSLKFYGNFDGSAFDIDNFFIEELPDLQIFPLANDTYTFDDVVVANEVGDELEFWFNADDVSGTESIFDFGSGTDGRMQLYMNDNDIIFLIEDVNGDIATQTLEATATDSTWYHVEISVDHVAQTWDATVNDVAITQKDWSALISANFTLQTNNVRLGLSNATTNYFNGYLGRININGNLSTWKVLDGIWTYVNLTEADIVEFTKNYVKAK